MEVALVWDDALRLSMATKIMCLRCHRLRLETGAPYRPLGRLVTQP